MINRSKYSSVTVTNPFTLTLDSGYTATPDNTRSTFMIEDATDRSVWCLVEATIVSLVLTINRVIQTTSTSSTIPVFINGASIFSMLDIDMLSSAQGQGRDAILLIGQSNMVGHNGLSENDSPGNPTTSGKTSGFDPLLDTPDSRILQIHTYGQYPNADHTAWIADSGLVGKYAIATEPLDHERDRLAGTNRNPVNSIGLGMTFAKRVVNGSDSGRQVVILPGASGSSSLTGGAWAAPSGSLYTNAVGMVNTFLAENPDNRIIAILWHQGESDSSSWATWGAALDNVISTLRSTAFTPTTRQPTFEKVPFIVGGLNDQWINNGGGLPNNRSRIDGEALAVTTRNSYCAFSDPDSNFLLSNFDLHVDAYGMRIWGNTYYEAYLEALDDHPTISSLPAGVQNLTGEGSPERADLTWDAMTGVDGFKVDRKLTSAGDETYVLQSTRNSAAVGYAQVGLTNGTDYTYRVTTFNAIGDTTSPDTVAVTPVADTAPTVVQNVTAIDGVDGITVSWTDLTYDPVVLTYLLQRRVTNSGAYNAADNTVITAPASSYLYAAAVEGTSYDFLLSAVNYINAGPTSPEVTQSHSSSPTQALSPLIWFQQGVGEEADPGDSAVMARWLDQSGNNNHGTEPTKASNTRSPRLTPGGGMTLDGWQGLYIESFASEGLEASTIGYTVVFDLTRTSETTGDQLWSQRDSNSIELSTSGRCRHIFDFDYTNNDFVTLDNRVQIAVTHEKAGAIKFYTNVSGTLVLDKSLTQTYDTSGGLVMLGCRAYIDYVNSAGNNGLIGTMYNFTLFEKILDQSEVESVIDEMNGVAAPDTAPTAVQNVAVVQNGTGLDITWDALVYAPVVTGYQIQISTTAGDYTSPVIDTFIGSQSTVTYTFASPVTTTTYYVNVFAKNSAGDGVNSTEASVTYTAVVQEMLVDYQRNIGLILENSGAGPLVETWQDQSGKANHGEATQSVNRFSTADGGLIGLVNGDRALYLDPDLELGIANEPFTILFDTKRTPAVGNSPTLYGSFSGTLQVLIRKTDGKLIVTADNYASTTIVESTAGFFAADTRFAFAISMGTDSIIRIHNADGTVHATAASPITATSSSRPTLMSRCNSATDDANQVRPWEGNLYSFTAYNYVRSQSQILTDTSRNWWGDK